MRRMMQGQTLIELMIALSLGLLISAAAIQLFIANQVAMNFQRGMNDVQANGRFALDQITHSIRLSGLNTTEVFTTSTTPFVPGIAFSASDIGGLPVTSTYISSNNTQTAGIANSDQLVIQYLGTTGAVNCEGNGVIAGSYVIERYYLVADAATNSRALACDAGSTDGTTVSGLGTGAEVLVSGVDSFQVLYGIDNGSDQVATLNRFVDAATYAAMSPRPAILAVRVGMYLRSQDRAGDAQAVAAPVQVLDAQIASTSIPNDGLLRRLFITTVAMRNVNASGV